jgi:CIC family chloride channel protein
MRQMLENAPGNSRPGSLGDFTADRQVLVLIMMALVVGAGGTAAAWVLLKLIAFFTNLVWLGRLSTADASPGNAAPGIWMVVAPILGGIVVGLMARYGSEKIRGHGIPEAIEAVLLGGGRMQPRIAILKPLSAAIAVGTGGPFGAEGPIIATGGAVGSLIAQCFNLTAAERKTLLVAGAASGMTGIFGTPVAAVLLAVELLLFEWKPRSLIPVIAAAVTAATLRPLIVSKGLMFPFSIHADLPWWGIALCAAAGIVAGIQSGVLSKLLYGTEDLFHRLPIHWMWWPALGGLAVGLGGLVEPRALGIGYDVIRDLFAGHMGADEAGRILIVKSAIWIIALASGTSGGVLAPLLLLGGTAGLLEGQILPGGAPFWALVGMAATMGGSMRAPLTAVVFGVELTGNFNMLLPLLAATGTSYAFTVLLLKRSILTEKIARRGHHIRSEYGVDPFELLRVKDAMVTVADTLPAAMTVKEAIAFFASDEARHKSYPVVLKDGRLAGMIARSDILRWRTEEQGGAATLYDVLSDSSVTAGYPDELLGDIADRMASTDHGRIPILERSTQKVIGLVSRKDLFRLRSAVNATERERRAYLIRTGKTRKVSASLY